VSLALVVRPSDRFVPDVATRLVDAVRRAPALRVCLPTGATPTPVYAEAVEAGLDLSAATVVLLDEFGGLPPDDPARCDVALRRDLLDRLPCPPARLERLDPDADDLDTEVARFDAAVADGGLGLTVLGLGANGHLGLNEPGTQPDAPTRRVDLHATTAAGAGRYGATRPPTFGLTLGMDRILASREIWLVVSGGHKAAILRETLTGPIEAAVPATFLRRHANVTVFADSDAATELGGGPSTEADRTRAPVLGWS
jgi:glucosamine-6-phosphate deaminase